MNDTITEFQAWAVKTFDKATAYSSIQKLKTELTELEDNPSIEEFADCFMCLLHSMAKLGFSADHLTQELKRKFEVNKKRSWRLNEDNTYSHI